MQSGVPDQSGVRGARRGRQGRDDVGDQRHGAAQAAPGRNRRAGSQRHAVAGGRRGDVDGGRRVPEQAQEEENRRGRLAEEDIRGQGEGERRRTGTGRRKQIQKDHVLGGARDDRRIRRIRTDRREREMLERFEREKHRQTVRGKRYTRRHQ